MSDRASFLQSSKVFWNILSYIPYHLMVRDMETSMGWQMPPMSICLGLVFILLGLVVGVDIRFEASPDDKK